MKKRMIACDICLILNAFLLFFLSIWSMVGISLGISPSQGDGAQIIQEASRQGYICFATYLLLIGISFLYLIYRLIVGFLIASNRIDEIQRRNIKKVTFILSCINLADVLSFMVIPVILSNVCNMIDLLHGSYFLMHVLPWSGPCVFGLYYIISSDFWKKENI